MYLPIRLENHGPVTNQKPVTLNAELARGSITIYT